MHNKMKLIGALGWFGVIATLGAYLLVSLSFVSATGFIFQGLNLAGALGLVIESYSKKDSPLVWLNAIWGLIALIAIVHILVHLNVQANLK